MIAPPAGMFRAYGAWALCGLGTQASRRGLPCSAPTALRKMRASQLRGFGKTRAYGARPYVISVQW
jgi:hypothetical protein